MSQRGPANKVLSRACPACDGAAGEVLFEQRFARIEGISILDGYDVVSCVRCGACFADGIPEQATFERYYRDASKYEGSGADASLPAATLARFRAEVADMAPHLSSPTARVLEVGCATGALLGMLKAHGFAHVSGLDPSPACAAIAAQKYGVRVHTGDLSAAGFTALSGERYDMIILIAVLEHVRDIGATLARLRSVLAPEGLLFVEVPDASRFERGQDAPFQEFSVEHINYFSGRSLAGVVEHGGFSTVALIESDRPHTDTSTAPCVSGVFRVSDAPSGDVANDRSARAALARYVEQSEQRERPMRGFVARLADTQQPLVVWGCGTLTLRLLATSELGRANIVAFVDGNRRWWGKSLRGITIHAPHELQGRSEPILVSSVGHQQAIAAHIERQLGASHPVLFYPG